jgi:histone H3/H4
MSVIYVAYVEGNWIVQFLVSLLEDANHVASHGKRVTV